MSRYKRDGTTTWRHHTRVGRLQLSLTVHRHSGHLPDRWVFQPSAVYDRKARVEGETNK